MNILTQKSGRVVTAVCALVYALVLLGGVYLAVRRPVGNWDAIPYMDLALMSQGWSPRSAHATVYRDIRRAGDPSLISADAWHKAMAASPALLGTFLPFYRFRVGYIFMIRAFHQGGLGLVSAARMVSAAGYIGIGVVLFLWMLRYASAPLALMGASLLMLGGNGLAGGAEGLAYFVTPDAVATFLVLCGIYFVVEKEAVVPGLAFLFVSLFFRTDEVLYILAILVWLAFSRRLKLYQAGILGLSSCGAVLLLNHFAGHYSWTILFNNSFGSLKAFLPAEEAARVSAREYFFVVFHNFHIMLTAYAPLLFLFGALSYLARPRNRASLAALLVTATVAVRYLLYPTPELRQYAPAVLICALAVLAALCSMGRAGSREPELSSAAASAGSPLPE